MSALAEPDDKLIVCQVEVAPITGVASASSLMRRDKLPHRVYELRIVLGTNAALRFKRLRLEGVAENGQLGCR